MGFDAALLVFRGALGRTQLARGRHRAQPRARVYPRAHQSVDDFYNTLQNLDQSAFYRQLMRFALLAAGHIVVAVYQLYLNQMLQIRWRRWLTNAYLGAWLGNRTYYRMQLTRLRYGQ